MSARPMKDTGIPWLGQIPAEWEVAQLRRLVDPRRPITYGIVLPGQNVDDGVFIIKSGDCTRERLTPDRLHRTTRSIEASYARSRMKADDLVISIRGTVGLVARLPASLDGANLTQDTARIAPLPEVHVGWLLHTLGSSPLQTEIDVETVGATVRGLNLRELRRLRVPRPPQREQRRIAAFLDTRTATVDAAITEHERTLTLLSERRQTLVSHAVTHGLDPNAPMRDSGVPWIGEIPMHWDVVRMRRVLRGIDQGWSPVAEDQAAGEGAWGVIKLSAIRPGQFRDSENKALPIGCTPSASMEIRPGDLLMSRANTPERVGDVCLVRTTRERLILSDLVFRLRPSEAMCTSEFLELVLLSQCGRIQIRDDARGSSASMVKIGQGQIRSWRVPLPPLDEQRAIVAHLRARTSVIDEAAETARRAIALLREYRQSLVTAAVTGRIDVGASS